MGVMACDRNGCDNLLCNKYSTEYGYICNECLEEMKNKQGNAKFTISGFMNSKKGEIIEDQSIDLDNIFT
ncbi:MAG: hypothetical protein DRG78_00460 [Epsilonproteobacteria bacterium]|nr:MAG: hypothetical protein DRG78_00460 [Campylobacterota bacterium]